jgi:hypothetical protein
MYSVSKLNTQGTHMKEVTIIQFRKLFSRRKRRTQKINLILMICKQNIIKVAISIFINRRVIHKLVKIQMLNPKARPPKLEFRNEKDRYIFNIRSGKHILKSNTTIK